MSHHLFWEGNLEWFLYHIDFEKKIYIFLNVHMMQGLTRLKMLTPWTSKFDFQKYEIFRVNFCLSAWHTWNFLGLVTVFLFSHFQVWLWYFESHNGGNGTNDSSRYSIRCPMERLGLHEEQKWFYIRRKSLWEIANVCGRSSQGKVGSKFSARLVISFTDGIKYLRIFREKREGKK